MINLFRVKMTIVFLLSFSTTSIFSQIESQHHFNFMGFSVKINDDAADENNNHMLVGEIRAIESENEKRDANINEIFELKGYANDDRMGIIITTDKDYKTLQIASSFIGKKVNYDRTKKRFTIGAQFSDYLHVDGQSFSAWQPMIIQLDLELKGEFYTIQKPYSCMLEDLIVENNELLIFTKSAVDPKSKFKRTEKAEIIRVKTSKFHVDKSEPRIKILDPLSTLVTPHNDEGRITLSDISKVDSDYYFTTSNLNQSTLENTNHLYQLKKDKLTEVQYFSNYLEWTMKYSTNLINMNGFIADSTKSYLFLSHKGGTKKEMIFSKTDTNFNTIISEKIPLNHYADFNKILSLSNGNIVILRITSNETWSYFLYNSSMEFLKEINSSIPKEYYPNKLKVSEKNHIKCIFYIDKTNKKDCVLQTINLN